MTQNITSFLAISVLTAAFSAGCGTECTQIGCASDLALRIEAPDWPEADYALTVRGNNQTITCTFTRVDEVNCTSDQGPSAFFYLEDSQDIELVAALNAPETLEVNLTADGTDLIATTVRPDYQTSQPNGARCDPTCSNAVVELTVP